MAGVNKAIILGNLGSDPEVRTTQGGKKVASFSVATSEQWKDRDGNRQERTEWHRIVIWNEGLVGVVERFLRKGSKVYLEGQIQTRKWTDQSGAEKYTTEIVLQGFNSSLVLVDSKREGDQGGGYSGGSSSGGGGYSGGGSGGGSYSQPQSRPQPAAFDTDLDDDVPF